MCVRLHMHACALADGVHVHVCMPVRSFACTLAGARARACVCVCVRACVRESVLVCGFLNVTFST